MTEELKPCPNPWCASELRVQKMVNPHTHKHRVICDLCELTGPYGTDEQEARHFWNTRPQDAEVERLRAENKRLRALATFGKWALDEAREYMSDLDGGDIQRHAVQYGLLREVAVTAENKCGLPDCNCVDGDYCYPYTDLAQLPEES